MKNKKIVYSSIALTSTLIISTTLSGILIWKNINNDDYIKFGMGDNSVVFKHDDVEKLREYSDSKIDDNIDNDELFSTREGETTDSGGDETTDSGDSTTRTQSEADWITSAFFELSLSGEITGDFNENGLIEDGETLLLENKNPIMSPSSDDDWLSSHLVDVANQSGSYTTREIYDKLFDSSLKVKEFYSTTGNSSATDITEFIMNYASESYEFGSIVYEINNIDDDIETWWDIANSSSYIQLKDLFSDFSDLLSEELSFQKGINKFLYIYSYLWQENPNSSYDTYLTQIMKENQFTYFWNYSFDDPKESFGISGIGLNNPESSAWSNYNSMFGSDESTNITTWNSIINETYSLNSYDVKNISSNKNGSLSDGGYRGFSGLTSKNSGVISFENDKTNDDENFWSYDNLYTFSGVEDNYSTFELANGFASKELFQGENGNYAFSKTTTTETGEGEEASTTTETSYNSYVKTLLYPFAFGYNFDDGTSGENPQGSAEKWVYSLNAYRNNTTNEYSYVESSNFNEKVNYFDLISDMTGIDVNLLELYFVNDVINTSTSSSTKSLEDKAYDFWRTKGFYIELSGDYEDTYSSLIPQGIQKK